MIRLNMNATNQSSQVNIMAKIVGATYQVARQSAKKCRRNPWVARKYLKTYRLWGEILSNKDLSCPLPLQWRGGALHSKTDRRFGLRAISNCELLRNPARVRMSFYLIVWLLLAVLGTQAQDGAISDNAVNAVAEKMYCPVCENIPLDECQTRACIEWKEEIRLQLAEGKDEAAVIDSFVRRFGDQVVGIPQDPVLRGLTVVTPTLALFLAIALGAYTFSRFGAHRRLSISDEADLSATVADEVYRQRLEEDLAARR